MADTKSHDFSKAEEKGGLHSLRTKPEREKETFSASTYYVVQGKGSRGV